jgi:hypothetical protein
VHFADASRGQVEPGEPTLHLRMSHRGELDVPPTWPDSNIESRDVSLLKYSVQPWLGRSNVQ